jgi:PmbA protein
MGRGLLVTELLGHGVNYVTGDYSRGAAGYWVETARLPPGRGITIAGNLRDMFRNMAAVGNDVWFAARSRSVRMLVEQMKVAEAAINR